LGSELHDGIHSVGPFPAAVNLSLLLFLSTVGSAPLLLVRETFHLEHSSKTRCTTYAWYYEQKHTLLHEIREMCGQAGNSSFGGGRINTLRMAGFVVNFGFPVIRFFYGSSQISTSHQSHAKIPMKTS
jgi:hypothetical protein